MSPSKNGATLTRIRLDYFNNVIPYGRQDITQADIDSVVSVLQSDFLTQGPQVPIFEEKLSEYTGAKFAIAVNSATSALHIACLSLGLGKGDRLWTSPITFVASANCGLYCGANIDFVDIDPLTKNLCPYALEQKLLQAKANGCLPKIVIPVHFAGQPCDMEAIYSLSKRFGFNIIEDASHAIGARYMGEPVGNCHYSDITIFSFHPVKIITTGEGGAAITNRPDLAEKMRLLRSHGITRDVVNLSQANKGAWYYEQVDLGFNYRMTDLQAALGSSQLNRLDDYVGRRHEIAAHYDKILCDLPVLLPPKIHFSSYHLYVVCINASATVKSRAEIFDDMRAQGVGVNVHYIPVHTQPYFERLGFATGDFPVSERYYDQAISLPIYPAMTDIQIIKVFDALRLAFEC